MNMSSRTYPFPNSFPKESETQFLKLVLCSDTEFEPRFLEWKASTIFDKIDYATTRLMPLLYLRLESLGIDDPIRGRLKGIYRLAWFSNQKILNAAM